MSCTVTADRKQVQEWLTDAVTRWHASGLRGISEHAWVDTGDNISVSLCDLCDLLANDPNPAPEPLCRALNLSPGATFADAVPRVNAILDQPIELTEAELVEDGAFAILCSEFFEAINKANPDDPSLPVAYSKQARRKQ